MNIRNLFFIIIFIVGVYYLYNTVINTVTYAGQQGRLIIQVLMAVLALMVINEFSKSF